MSNYDYDFFVLARDRGAYGRVGSQRRMELRPPLLKNAISAALASMSAVSPKNCSSTLPSSTITLKMQQALVGSSVNARSIGKS